MSDADKEVLEVFDYLKVIPKFKERGVPHKVKCLCGGTITAIRSTYNGHLHVKCDKCKFTLME